MTVPAPRRPNPRRAEPGGAARGRGSGERSGAAGERVAAELLRWLGHAIHARDLRTVHGEIDLLARRRREWIAVEVKARADHPAPERLVDDDRLQRLERALTALAPTLRPLPRALRIDVVAVRWQADGGAEVTHFTAVRRLAVPGRRSTPDWRGPQARCYAWPIQDGTRHATNPTQPTPPPRPLLRRLLAFLRARLLRRPAPPA